VEHDKFEGHVTPNEDEYQISVQLRFGYYLRVHNSRLVILLFAYWWRRCLWNHPLSHISDLCGLDLWLGHTAYCHVSLTDLFYIPNFSFKLGKLSVDRRMVIWAGRWTMR